MENEEQLKKAAAELQYRITDVRAEAWVASALEKDLQPSEFVAVGDRSFEREFTFDISDAEVVEADWLNQYILLHLSRPGFYDLLPEGLFFQPGAADRQRIQSIAEMAAQYRANKQKEKEVRRFFQPFENEFFQQQVALEQEEVRLLDGLQQGKLSHFLRRFWDLPENLNANCALSLLVLLPYAHQIAANLPLMQQALALLLQEPVFIQPGRPRPIAVGDLVLPLGEQALGDTMVCGTCFWEDYPVLEYHIGPLQNSSVSSYLSSGENDLLIQTFNHFFAPAEANIAVQIEFNSSQAGMEMTAAAEPVLGYTTVL